MKTTENNKELDALVNGIEMRVKKAFIGKDAYVLTKVYLSDEQEGITVRFRKDGTLIPPQ
jgi:hypothetical protein